MRMRVKSNRFHDLASRAGTNADIIADASAESVALAWAAGVGVRTGNLRDSIHAEKAGLASYAAVSNVFYAPHHEFGFRNYGGNHSAVQSASTEFPRFVEALTQRLLA